MVIKKCRTMQLEVGLHPKALVVAKTKCWWGTPHSAVIFLVDFYKSLTNFEIMRIWYFIA